MEQQRLKLTDIASLDSLTADDQTLTEGNICRFWDSGHIIPAMETGGAPSGTRAPPGPPAWQLFNLIDDPTEQCDVSEFHPEVVAELAEEWRQAAWHNTVFPLPDGPELFDTVPSTVLELEQPLTLRPGTPTLERYRSSRLIFLRSFEMHFRPATFR